MSDGVSEESLGIKDVGERNSLGRMGLTQIEKPNKYKYILKKINRESIFFFFFLCSNSLEPFSHV